MQLAFSTQNLGMGVLGCYYFLGKRCNCAPHLARVEHAAPSPISTDVIANLESLRAHGLQRLTHSKKLKRTKALDAHTYDCLRLG